MTARQPPRIVLSSLDQPIDVDAVRAEAKAEIIKLARALARQAAWEDHTAALQGN